MTVGVAKSGWPGIERGDGGASALLQRPRPVSDLPYRRRH